MLEDDPEEEQQSDDFTKPRKEHYRSKWKHSQDAVYWFDLATERKTKDYKFWQTRSNAIVVHFSVPWECTYKVICKKRRTSFIRETRRFDLHHKLYSKVLGKRSSSNSSSKTPLKVHLPAAGNRTARKIHLLKKSLSLKFDLRIEGTRSRCDLEGWRANEPNTRSSGKLRKRPIPEIYSGRSEKTRKLCDLQRGIQTHHP